MGARFLACGLVLVGCANASEAPPLVPVDAPPDTLDAPPPEVQRTCPAGQLATDVGADGEVQCAAIDAPVKSAIDASCALYLGWRDSCEGCALPPTKWGRAGATCSAGIGLYNTCTSQTLGGDQVPLLGVNTDGDVDENDKLYGALHCAAPQATTGMAPCAPGELVTGRAGTGWACGSLADVAVGYARDHCALYLGWRDSCDGCSFAPTKWGWAGSGRCQSGAGAGNTCSFATLGGENVDLLGLDLDGDVNDDDKIYVGLACDAPAPATGSPTTICPPGQFVSGTLIDGSFACAGIDDAVYAYLTQRCTVYFGWRDNCEGCGSPPAKWGSVKVGECAPGTGTEGTCSKLTLGDTTVDLYGLGTDGDVNDDDTFYIGLRCN